MDLRCPKCNSTDLKKVSLVYQEGLYGSESRSRLRAVVIGGGGPDMVVGQTTTGGSQQSALSNKLSPPVKWSYRKVIFWSGLVFVWIGWLVFYVNTFPTNSPRVVSPPLTLFAMLSAGGFALLLFLVWRHNHSSYSREYDEWDRSFICERCGAVSPHD
jgi:hypothetical protein